MISPANWQYGWQETAYPECESVTEMVWLVVQRFDNDRNPLSPADAGSCQPIAQSIPPQLIQNRNHQPRTGSTQRMPKRDRSAVDIRLLALQPQHFFQDRKSTRLNSSHANISYAVFCLK